MQTLQNLENTFTFDGINVECIVVNGQPLFNPYHVGECLGISKSTVRDHLCNLSKRQVVKLFNSDVENTNTRKLNNAGENFLTESGVYKLVFKSNKDNAERFQDWVTDEVLPSIRKNGGYIVQHEGDTREVILARAFKLAYETIQEKDEIIENQKEQIGTLECKIEEDKPKVKFADDVLSAVNNMTIGDFSKVIDRKYDMGRSVMFAYLREHKYLMSNNAPYQMSITQGLFDARETKIDMGCEYITKIQPLITPKGQKLVLEQLRAEYEEKGFIEVEWRKQNSEKRKKTTTK